MPRGRKKKLRIIPKIKPETIRSIFASFLLLFSLLSYISFVFSEYTLNSKIKDLWFTIFGNASWLAPIITIGVGFLLIPSIEIKIKEPRIIMGMSILLIYLSTILHLFKSPESALEIANNGGGGGLVGYQISTLLVSTISIYGAFVLLLFFFAVGIILLFNISFDDIVEFISDKLNAIAEASAALFGKFNSKGAVDETDMEISSGTPVSDSSEPVEDSQQEVIDEPIIEVIPSFSEPTDRANIPKPLGSHASGLQTSPVLGPTYDKIWQFPPLELLKDYSDLPPDTATIESRKKKIKEVLKSFNIDGEITETKEGPSVTQYQLKTEFGTRVAQISSLQNDLAMALESPTGTVRIEAPIPGKSLIGIEVPNNNRSMVSFKSLITSEPMKALKSKLGIALGKDVGGRVLSYDIGKMPHMLVAGTTGSGKSIFIHNVLFSILFRATPNEVKLILIDPKRVELIHYEDIPHLITPVVTDMEKAPSVFKWAVVEMERRYKLLQKARVPNIDAYNEQSGFQAMPYIVIVVDELAEIMLLDSSGVEKTIIRLAQLARAVGIHLLLAVQRPSTNIITGSIKANIPCRIAFNVASQIDSRVIIDQQGAEKLLGKGDMLFVPPDVAKPVRLQGGFVSSEEIKKIVTFLKDQGMPPMYDEALTQMTVKAQSDGTSGSDSVDSLYEEAVDTVITAKKASTSFLQRKLSIGYSRAAKLMDELEMRGIIAPSEGTSKPRKVLVEDSYDPTKDDTSEDLNELESLQQL